MSDEPAPQPRIKITWLIGTLAAFSLFVVIGIYSSRMTRHYINYDQQRATERYATLTKLREDARQTLTTADWVDQTKGIIRIPIDEAMAREIDTLKSQPAQAGCEIPGAAPAPATTTPPPAASVPAAAGPASATPPPPKSNK